MDEIAGLAQDKTRLVTCPYVEVTKIIKKEQMGWKIPLSNMLLKLL